MNKPIWKSGKFLNSISLFTFGLIGSIIAKHFGLFESNINILLSILGASGIITTYSRHTIDKKSSSKNDTED